jgi:hypothetical protein
MPLVGFEHTISVFNWVKTFHALHRRGTLTLKRILRERFNQSAWIGHDKDAYATNE